MIATRLPASFSGMMGILEVMLLLSLQENVFLSLPLITVSVFIYPAVKALFVVELRVAQVSLSFQMMQSKANKSVTDV